MKGPGESGEGDRQTDGTPCIWAPRFPTPPHIGHEARILRRMVSRARGSEARYQTTATRIHERILRDLTVPLGRAKDEFTTPHLAYKLYSPIQHDRYCKLQTARRVIATYIPIESTAGRQPQAQGCLLAGQRRDTHICIRTVCAHLHTHDGRKLSPSRSQASWPCPDSTTRAEPLLATIQAATRKQSLQCVPDEEDKGGNDFRTQTYIELS
jgi:hypothetical protein